jgi:CubicO group peptidase (beta-lactamase class C family)
MSPGRDPLAALITRRDGTIVVRIHRLVVNSFARARRVWVAALVGVLALLAGVATATGASTPLESRLAAATDAFAAAHPTYPGVALAVVSPHVRWTGSAGHGAFRSHAVLDPRAGFRIASVTKTFTAAAVLRLVEQGRLGLDDAIAEHLAPTTVALLRSGSYDPEAIHVRQLLMHTSGLTTTRAIPSSSGTCSRTGATTGPGPSSCASRSPTASPTRRRARSSTTPTPAT